MANPLTVITSLADRKSRVSNEIKGVVKRDWVPTGRIDFATKINGNDDPSKPSEFKLIVEERRIIESVAGNEHLEIQWRPATLKEAKAIITQYHKYLTEHGLIRSIGSRNLGAERLACITNRNSGFPYELIHRLLTLQPPINHP